MRRTTLYGNLTQTTAWGDPASGLDNLQTAFTFSVNTSAYIVNRVGLIEQRPPGGAALTRETREYDNQSGPPTKGDLTAINRWLEPGGRWVTRTFEYTATGDTPAC